MSRTRHQSWIRHFVIIVVATVLLGNPVHARAKGPDVPAATDRDDRLSLELTAQQWQRLDGAVDRGLRFLATQQEEDGSFPTLVHAKPGVTGLAVLAFLSRGHLPNKGPYGQELQRAVEFVLTTQRSDGLLTIQPVEPTLTSHGVSHTGLYNHGIAGLMLAEVYGMSEAARSDAVKQAIVKGLEFARSRQVMEVRPGGTPGGFDYLVPSQSHNGLDLPITSCQLLFFRSARNAGFDVPADNIDAAMRYVKSCYNSRSHTFTYRNQSTMSRGLTGCGILALSLGGEHHTEMAQDAGRWVLSQSFSRFNTSRTGHDRYFYSAYYCSQAMFQLGGEYWTGFYPPLLETLAQNQRADGSWNNEMSGGTSHYGNAYSSALAILALTPPYQLLPIYQR